MWPHAFVTRMIQFFCPLDWHMKSRSIDVDNQCSGRMTCDSSSVLSWKCQRQGIFFIFFWHVYVLITFLNIVLIGLWLSSDDIKKMYTSTVLVRCTKDCVSIEKYVLWIEKKKYIFIYKEGFYLSSDGLKEKKVLFFLKRNKNTTWALWSNNWNMVSSVCSLWLDVCY